MSASTLTMLSRSNAVVNSQRGRNAFFGIAWIWDLELNEVSSRATICKSKKKERDKKHLEKVIS